jgi:hypothetical protein
MSYPLLGSWCLGGLSVTAAEKLIADGLRNGNFVRQPAGHRGGAAGAWQPGQRAGPGQPPRPLPARIGRHALTDLLAMAGGVAAGGADMVVLSGTRDGQPFRMEVDLPAAVCRRRPRQGPRWCSTATWSGSTASPGLHLRRGAAPRPDAAGTRFDADAGPGHRRRPHPRGTEKGIRVHRKAADGKVQVMNPRWTTSCGRRRGLRAREPVLSHDAHELRPVPVDPARALVAWLVLVLLADDGHARWPCSLLLPRQYTATASVVVDFKPDPMSPWPSAAWPRRPSWPRRWTSSAASAWRSAWCATSSSMKTRRCASSGRTRHAARAASNQWLIRCCSSADGRGAFARKQRHQLSYKAPDPRFAAGAGQRLCAGLHRHRARTAHRPGALYATFFDTRVQGSARRRWKRRRPRERLPEGQRHHRQRRAAGR